MSLEVVLLSLAVVVVVAVAWRYLFGQEPRVDERYLEPPRQYTQEERERQARLLELYHAHKMFLQETGRPPDVNELFGTRDAIKEVKELGNGQTG